MELYERLRRSLDERREASLLKTERVLSSPQGSEVRVTGMDKTVLNFCSNDYLGLSNHPSVKEAARKALDTYGYGLSSVRFICGTQRIHKEMEERISDWLGMEETLLYTSCFNANGGLFESLLEKDDSLVSARLNHASIIDGARLAKCRRFVYGEDDPADLDRVLTEAVQPGSATLVMTDGVFSMEGSLAPLREILPVCRRHGALLAVDDSHAAGFVGPQGRGTPSHFTVQADIITGTLGKALGGACGGYISGKHELIEWLRNTSRPYLFSNSLAPSLVAGAMAALQIVQSDEGDALRERLQNNTVLFRNLMAEAGFRITEGGHPIVPIILHDAGKVAAMAERLLEEGIYVIGFSYPVVPRESPRIRVQISAAHTRAQIERTVRAFTSVGRELGVIRGGKGLHTSAPDVAPTMRAWVYRQEEQSDGTHLSLEEMPIPSPHPGDLLLKIRKVSVCGTDEDLFHGKFADTWDGIVPGHEIFGEIVELGANVHGFEEGQKIVAESHYQIPGYVGEGIIGLWGPKQTKGGSLLPLNGGYAEYMTLPSYCAHVVPDSLDIDGFFPSLLEGAGNDCLIAHYLLERNLLGCIGVAGCGPHGLFTQMFCKHFGAARLAAFEVNRERLDFAAAFGADQLINPLDPEAPAITADFTDGRGFDVFIDTAGGRLDVLRMCLDNTRDGGTLILFGLYGDENIKLGGYSINDIIFNQRSLVFSHDGKEIAVKGITGREGIWPYLIDTVALSADLRQKIMKPVTVMGPLERLGPDTPALDKSRIMKRAYLPFSRSI